MFYHAKNGKLTLANTDMDYITFGTGEKNLVMIPGLGDGLKTVKGSAVPLALMYRQFAKDYKVYVFSRKNHFEKGYSTSDMADDLARGMKKLGILKASVMGISQGGMIAQYMAIHHSDMVDKLILAVTSSKPNPTLISAVNGWIGMAKEEDYRSLFIDTIERSYSEKAVKKYRWFYPVLTRIGKPKDYRRFILQAEACLHHNAYSVLNRIQCETLVIGGDCDHVVGGRSSGEIARKIPGSRLKMYHGLGHMTYEEAKDFNSVVLEFLAQ